MQRMYYKNWDNGLPIGNGRLAGMIRETDNTDIITVNHEKLWSGVKRHRKCIEGAEYLPLVRKLLLEDKPFEATAAVTPAGAVAAVLEALVSVSGGRIRLLQVLPDAWAKGKLEGVYIPGGHRISFCRKDGRAE